MLYIVTLNEMKADLGIEDSRDDAVLTNLLEGLQDRFDDHCRRTLLRQVNAEEICDGGVRTLYLKSWPIESIASIHLSADQTWDATTLLDDDAYKSHKLRGRLVYGTSGKTPWPAGVQNIRVVSTGGYLAVGSDPDDDQHAMPEALRRAMFMQAGFEWRNRENLGVTQVSAGGASKQVGAGVALALKGKTLMPEVEQTLMPFRRIL